MQGHDLTQHPDYIEAKEFPKRRRRLSAVETKLLSEVFAYNQKPNAKVRQDLGRKLNMTPRAVQIWFQNKRAKVKKGISSPLMDDYDQGNLFTPSKEKVDGFITPNLPTPPGSVFFRGPAFGDGITGENLPGYPETSNFFWNGNPSDLPTGPLSFVGSRSEIIVDFFNNQVETQVESMVLSPTKSNNGEEHLYVKNEKEESLLVNFLHPISAGQSRTSEFESNLGSPLCLKEPLQRISPDLMTPGSSHLDSFTIFRDSPYRTFQ